METVTRDDYVNLRRLLLNKFIDNNKLQKLKLIYESEINSKRRMDCINSLEDLVKLLEKRACVSEKNIKIFEEMAVMIDNREYLSEISNRCNISQSPINVQPYAPVANAVLVENSDTDIKHRVHDLILEEIGVKWVDFARALEIRESTLDNIKIGHRNNSRACVKEVLDIYKNNVHPRDWKLNLLEALSKARRNDLRKAVDKIFSTYSL